MRVKDLLKEATVGLAGISESPRLDAEVLLGALLRLDRLGLISRAEEQVGQVHVDRFREFTARRARREPVAYITGEKEFFGLTFKVTPDVLVPRPETEMLVELGLEAVEGRSGTVSILDVGTGSGCVAVALAVELKKAGARFLLTASDISPEALKIAGENAEVCGVADKIRFIKSDLFSTSQTSVCR